MYTWRRRRKRWRRWSWREKGEDSQLYVTEKRGAPSHGATNRLSVNMTSTGHAATRCSVNTLARARPFTRRGDYVFRVINDNHVFDTVEMATVNYDGVQSLSRVPFYDYRKSHHHPLVFERSMSVRSSLKQETWGKRTSRLKIHMDLLGVSPLYTVNAYHILLSHCPREYRADVLRYVSST